VIDLLRKPPCTVARLTTRVLHCALLGAALAALSPAPAEARLRNDRPPAIAPTDDYTTRDDVQEFIAEIAARNHYDPAELTRLLGRANHVPAVLRLIAPPTVTFKRSWAAYRQRFLDPVRIAGGVAFWQENEAALARASEQFGVPPEIVVAIIGVETLYGKITGKFRIIDALVTLGFDDPRRAAYFRSELEQFLLWTRDSGIDPLAVLGSYAGAIGLPQFMPGSIRNYAVDFDGDGVINLRDSATDAIGSVANFLTVHGWQAGEPTHFNAIIEDRERIGLLTDAGIEPSFSSADLALQGVVSLPAAPAGMRLALVDLPNGDDDPSYYLGARNFYVITRYNRSSFYAMAVLELAQALRTAHARP